MTLQDYLIIVLTISILLTGGVFYLWLQELGRCEEKLIEYYKINKSLGMVVFVNESSPFNPAGTPREGQQNILFQGVDDNISMLMYCQGKTEFNFSEWEACNKILRRAPA